MEKSRTQETIQSTRKLKPTILLTLSGPSRKKILNWLTDPLSLADQKLIGHAF